MQGLYLFVLVFLVMSLVVNIMPNFPRLPGDINLEKVGIHIRIPFFFSLAISVILLLFGKMLLPI